jgi:alpha-galactosidase
MKIRYSFLLFFLIFGWASPAQQISTQPKINGPRLYGASPGKEFMYTIAAIGSRPMQFEVKNLPKGVKINKTSGVISGTIKKAGEYTLELVAQNEFGKASKSFTLVIGDRLALTPPMGWSSWYSFGRNVTLDKVVRSAEIIKEKGLQQYGWSIIEIDDPWTNQPDPQDAVWEQLKSGEKKVYDYYEGPDNLPKRKGQPRNAKGELLPNTFFSNIKKFPAIMHQMGFKAGIYSSPGAITCAGVAGSYGHELTDAKFFADNGFDYLKYDWCSYGAFAKSNSKAALIKPYRIMSDALKLQKRDLIHALCQYGMGNVWEWGNESGGQLWRTGDDVHDSWESVRTAFKKLSDKAAFVKPGNWNDPDILQVGSVGAQSSGKAGKNRLTFEEQKTVMSMWCMLSAPLLIGADVEQLDDATLSLLTNEEIIAVNQDALGKAASLRATLDHTELWVKQLEDGSIVLGLLNLSNETIQSNFPFAAIQLKGKYKMRNLWVKEDLGVFENEFETTIPAHGIVMLQLLEQQ